MCETPYTAVLTAVLGSAGCAAGPVCLRGQGGMLLSMWVFTRITVEMEGAACWSSARSLLERSLLEIGWRGRVYAAAGAAVR